MAGPPGIGAGHSEPVSILWITSGLGCDGDSIAMTAATNPSLEDLLRGCLPGMPPVILHNPMLAYESGAEFMESFHRAAAGRLDPFILVLEGAVPNEEINGDGHWAGMGVDAETGQPILVTTWIDRLAPQAAAVLALGTCAAYGGIPAMRNNPTGAMGLRDYLGSDWRSRRELPPVNLPGCPVQPDNITETLLCLVLEVAGMAPPLELDDQGRPLRLFGRTVHESCDRAGMAEG
ncbi:MAG: hydrogenase expression protein HypE, partial [Actinomycetota bacterium]|nr:hydrogenase expression protein HypE [Actinomycetota bacterium]